MCVFTLLTPTLNPSIPFHFAEPEVSPRSSNVFAYQQNNDNDVGGDGGSFATRDGMQLPGLLTYETNYVKTSDMISDVAPLTNNSISSSGTHSTTNSSSLTDDSMKSPRNPRNPVTGRGIAPTFRRPRKMDVHRGRVWSSTREGFHVTRP